ncbi:hypothetical protein H6G80_05810 [Nostoc sp. FACHB-87]|uniref:hypothetical protein n=1 Tax=Nostocales TaxID=1161 RepID=UPI001685CE90|nr:MULTISPECIES: hypothetical protein [Nostocales]MBD2300689.1 hypothetical protein [Nostoc sp. FACHB-190]MBD2453590.1 hypothetical protein [Nostoc sp. FACHB-87]MBD2475716.1 hypothetical protein [Anabaena sp. FACHB-83]MBD2492252.1 hypothetical protein [Aulosira sp. FACHB-615]
MESKPRIFKQTAKETTLLFAGGAGAGLIIFALFGGLWHITHFWWVMAATTIFCGLLAVVFRQKFQQMLNALMDNAPGI